MLAGIKKGKRKRKSKLDSTTSTSSTTSFSERKNNDTDSHTIEKDNPKRNKVKKATIQENVNNTRAAEELRKMLSDRGNDNRTCNSMYLDRPLKSNQDNCNSGSNGNSSSQSKNSISSAIERFEKRRGANANGRMTENEDGYKEGEETVVMMEPISATSTGKPPILSKEDFRRGARKGKVKQKTIDSSYGYMHSSADKTISEMVQEEKQSKQSKQQGMDEIFARNVARMGSRYKGTDFQMVAGSTAGADEDDGSSIDMKMFTSVSNRLTDAERYNRELSRQLAYTKKQNSIANKCWWWLESEMFQKHRLIALGDHVSDVYNIHM